MKVHSFDDEFGCDIRAALKKYHEPYRDDFTESVLKRVRLVNERKLLHSVMMREKLALAALLVVPVIFIVTLLVWPDAAKDIITGALGAFSLTERGITFIEKNQVSLLVSATAIVLSCFGFVRFELIRKILFLY